MVVKLTPEPRFLALIVREDLDDKAGSELLGPGLRSRVLNLGLFPVLDSTAVQQPDSGLEVTCAFQVTAIIRVGDD